MKDIVNFLIDDFHERALPELVPREKVMPHLKGKASVVVGMRRSGKTWYCYQHMKELLDEGIPKERILYLNFEDDRLLPFSAGDFQTILDTYYRKFPSFKTMECFYFFDEIQRIQGWETFVRRVLDTESIRLHVTGSSSKLLSSEIASALRGRSLTTEIYPFSFSEFLTLRGEERGEKARYGSRKRASLQHLAGLYMKTGGFPEVQSLETASRHEVLRNYLDVVILRDVVERHGVGNVGALRSLIRQAISAPGGRFSVNRFYNTMKSRGISCTKNSLYDYLDYLTDAFMIYQVPIYARSEKVRQVNPRKLYAVDTGLVQAMSHRITRDDGALLENLVFMHLRRYGISPAYCVTSAGTEVDFVFNTPTEDGPQPVQVCWDLSDSKTKNREVQSLLQAMRELGSSRGTIVTWLDEDDPGNGIDVVPAWKWLLGSPRGVSEKRDKKEPQRSSTRVLSKNQELYERLA
jgi:predicted AAA+ superfamily ATPase